MMLSKIYDSGTMLVYACRRADVDIIFEGGS